MLIQSLPTCMYFIALCSNVQKMAIGGVPVYTFSASQQLISYCFTGSYATVHHNVACYLHTCQGKEVL